MKKSADKAEKTYEFTISDLRGQMAPLERRFQEVTHALVHAKELETSALKESQVQAEIAKQVYMYIFVVTNLLFVLLSLSFKLWYFDGLN